jgi:hypothetical protein
MEILIPIINWIFVYILLKTFFKKYILNTSKSPYYSLSIIYVLFFNFIKDMIIYLLTSLIFFYGFKTKSFFAQTFIELINWILIFILSKSIFELSSSFILKSLLYKFSYYIEYFSIYIRNFTVKKSLLRSLFSIPWIILTYLLYKYT